MGIQDKQGHCLFVGYLGGKAKLGNWRTAGGAEVDFVVLQDGVPLPIEVKEGNMYDLAVSRSLRSFISAFSPPAAVVVNGALSCSITIESTTVHFMPLYAL